ncbi:macrolide 2'-phosphotransferase [Geomicrobium sp. JCM 19055]|uniref:macrolide 2'-phosphotransferase n=1 Tax=Geomicrobium sp. JCM 19055 TaxID=1460649 RepID=UPI00045ED044|nr:macrolide 2'-phosphotransferase [Geomicrobium sp. JCM 19055]GAJ98499.1 macrolide 2-phosphotransferase [Geomicrobium sp. JCM 19055]
MNKQELKQLVENHGLYILEESVQMNESGVDFQVAHAKDTGGEPWIIRIPRRKESMRNAKVEKQALDVLERTVNFQVPTWSIFSEEVIAYKQLKGSPAATIDLEQLGYKWSFDEKNVPKEYIQSLGSVMANLHTVEPKEFKGIPMEILTAQDLKTSMKQRMERVKESYEIHPDLWERWQVWLGKDFWPSFVGVKHGDLHPAHILLNDDHRVTGLIDWTEIGIGDSSVDFMSHLLLFGDEGLKKLIDAYDNAGGRTWSGMEDHIKELLSTSAITVAEYAQVSGLQEMHETAKSMLSQRGDS